MADLMKRILGCRSRLSRISVMGWLACGVVALGTSVQGSEALSFNRDIRPILSENCFICHGPDEENRSAGLRLDERASAIAGAPGDAAIVPGSPEQSELVRRINAEDPDDLMPPADSERSLTAEERQLLEAWIAAGAPYQRHWALESVRRPPLPEVIAAERGVLRSPIDYFILQQLQAEGLEFSPLVSREKLIRRVTFDLTGLPPTLEEIDQFLADQAIGSYERLVDRLLRSESYGERMASEWLDVARYSDTYGYQVDRDRFVWPWRDWVIEAFNANLPYDDFITWQVAGDLLENATDQQILATTFNRLHPQKVEGGSVPEEFRIEYVADRTQTFATAFMALTLECARCHDHKYDPLKQREYYQLSSFFANVDEAGLYSYFTSATPTPTHNLGPADNKRELATLQERLTRFYEELEETASEAGLEPFTDWLATGRSNVASAEEQSLAYFDFESFEDGKLPNRRNEEKPATSAAANTLVDGRRGKGLQLSGDDEVDLKVGNFKRSQDFSFSLWIKIPEQYERAVVFHRSRAWTDAASRGYQLLLENGRPSFSLIHFWPGNALRVRTVDPLPVNEYVHVGIAYGGTSQADGVSLYVNGKAVETEVVRDLLTKNITGGGHDEIAIGARFRDKGFKGGAVDEFHVFDRWLSPLEMLGLYDEEAAAALLQKPEDDLSAEERTMLESHYVGIVDTDFKAAKATLLELREKICELENGMQEIMVMKERSMPRTSYVLSRGAYDNRAAPVVNETPAILPPFPQGAPRNRLGLANWLTAPEHPLTARVAVNRYWQMIFGQGLVRTPEDFGSQGKLPTHPELLDWLAADFVEHGWDVKRLLRQMVTSTTYQQDSRVTDEHLERDPENMLLSRGARYRLPAEMIRDNALAVSELLVNRIGGPPVKPYEVAVSFKPAKVDEGDGLYRRSLYTYWKRTGPAPVMMALDAAKRDVCSVKRETTATPLQSFVFMNDPQFVEAARQLAVRITRELGAEASVEDQVSRLFRTLTSRFIKPAERDVVLELYADQVQYFREDEERVKAFLGVGSSELDPSQQTAELAALSVVASGLLSHDECIMKR